jgi:hypothetical protein
VHTHKRNKTSKLPDTKSVSDHDQNIVNDEGVIKEEKSHVDNIPVEHVNLDIDEHKVNEIASLPISPSNDTSLNNVNSKELDQKELDQKKLDLIDQDFDELEKTVSRSGGNVEPIDGDY